MIYCELIEVDRGGLYCSNSICKNSKEYTVNIIGSVYHLKQGTTAAHIGLTHDSEVYCGGCITEVFNIIKSKLDKNLWPFH